MLVFYTKFHHSSKPAMRNKLINRFNIHRFIAILFIISTAFRLSVQAQQNIDVVDKFKNYKKQVRDDSTKKMISLIKTIPGLRLDLRYATNINFTAQILYTDGKDAYLRLPVASALLKVQQELNKKGYGLKIFDAYRPYHVTVKMWELIKDERYVANPAKGSGHNRGIAVDITIIDLRSGKELDMGTGFDNFTDSAHHDFKKLSPDILRNRALLRETMERYGFKALETEWWHYSWSAVGGFEVLDLNFAEFKKRIK